MKSAQATLLATFIFLIFCTGLVFAQQTEDELLKSAFTKVLFNRDFDGAIADATAAIKLNPKSGLAYRSRGSFRQEKGDLAGAVEDYSAAIKLDPTKLGYYENRAGAYTALGDSKSAIADYDTALKMYPKDESSAALYQSRGKLRLSLKDYEGAISDFGKTVELNPLSFPAYEMRAEAYRATGRTTLAEIDDKSAAEAKQKVIERLKTTIH